MNGHVVCGPEKELFASLRVETHIGPASLGLYWELLLGFGAW